MFKVATNTERDRVQFRISSTSPTSIPKSPISFPLISTENFEALVLTYNLLFMQFIKGPLINDALY